MPVSDDEVIAYADFRDRQVYEARFSAPSPRYRLAIEDRHALLALTRKYREHSIRLNTLSWRIADAVGDVPPGATAIVGDVDEQLDRLLTLAGPAVPARPLTTTAELDALPVGTVVLGDDGAPWIKRNAGWCTTGRYVAFPPTAGGLLPARVLTPLEPDPSPDEATLVAALMPTMASWGVRSQHSDWSDEEAQRDAARHAVRVLLAALRAGPTLATREGSNT